MLTLTQHAYRAIRQRLEHGDLSPGSRVSDHALAKEIGISRGPVREAIIQLTSEGFVEHRPRRGSFVKSPNRQEIKDFWELRTALESFAAAAVAERRTEADLAELQRLNRALLATVRECRTRPSKIADEELTDQFLSLDLDFHICILNATGNERMVAIVRECHVLSSVFGHVPVLQHDLGLMAVGYRHHSSILRAILRHDPEGARDGMTRHIRFAEELVLAASDKAEEDRPSE